MDQRHISSLAPFLGQNQIAKLVGTADNSISSTVLAAAPVSPPFDFLTTSKHIDNASAGVYRPHFFQSRLPKGLAQAKLFPALIDPERMRSIRTLQEFDDVVTSQLHGFASAEDYYRKVSWPQFAPTIELPLLVLAFHDDPFSPTVTVPQKSENQQSLAAPIAHLTWRPFGVGWQLPSSSPNTGLKPKYFAYLSNTAISDQQK